MTTPIFSPLQNEQVLLHSEFSPNLILKHLKVTMILTNQRVYLHEPHTVLGFIPFGGRQQSVPLECVSDVSSGEHTSSSRAMMGAGAAIFGVLMLLGGAIGGSGSALLGLVLIVIGGILMLTARSVAVVVRSTGGGTLTAPGSSADRPATDQMHLAVTTEVAKALSGGNA